MAHVLVFPLPGQGHISPILQFAKRLVFKGIKVTLATTIFLSNTMQAEVDSIKIEAISDGYDDGGCDSSNSVEDYLQSFRDVGSRTLAELIRKYETSDSPFTCIVYDSFIPWVLDIAKEFGLSKAFFFTQSCATVAIYYYIRKGWLTVPPLRQDDDLMLGLPTLAMSDFPTFIADKGSNPYILSMAFDQFCNLDEADWIFVNSFHKLVKKITHESEY